jgi:hypothetical protein
MSMVASDADRASEERRREGGDEGDVLPFTVKIVDRAAGERVLARAASASLARAIFGAARTEFPHARVQLKRGSEIILDSDVAG